MERTIINSYEEFASFEGKQLGVSDWLTVDQPRVNAFADATLDIFEFYVNHDQVHLN